MSGDSTLTGRAAPPEPRNPQPFALYTSTFAAGIYASIKALELTSVGAVIAARSCLPVAVAALEVAFMHRALPSARRAPCRVTRCAISRHVIG